MGGDMGKPMAGSCWCLVETKQYCKAIILQLKINKVKKIKLYWNIHKIVRYL